MKIPFFSSRHAPSSAVKFAAAWVEVKNNFAFVFAQSGGAGLVPDHDAFSTHFAFPPAGLELGAAVRTALSASRHLDPKVLGIAVVEEFMFKDAQKRNNEYLKQAQQLTGTKSERAFSAGIKACRLFRVDDRVQVTPTLDGHGSWGNQQATDDDYRYFAVDASDDQIQVTVLEALSLSR